MRNPLTRLLSIGLLVAAPCFLAGCGGSGGIPTGGLQQAAPTSVSGTITGGGPLAGAKIYLIPASQIDMTPITGADVLDGTSEDYDEPLEDAIARNGASYQSATTDANGQYTLSNVTAGDYFFYVAPAATDTTHLPGGDQCRIAQSSTNFLGTTVNVTVSSKPPADATYVGSTRCLTCHSSEAGHKYTAHRLGFSKPKAPGALQDHSNFPDFDDALDLFTAADAYGDADVTRIVIGTNDDGSTGVINSTSARLADLQTADPDSDELVNAYLWQDNNETDAEKKFKITLEDVATPAQNITLTVRLTYGGAVYKQRFLAEIPASVINGNVARKGLYPSPLQYQGYPGISAGNDNHYDIGRLTWTSYHFERWFDAADADGDGWRLEVPATTKNFEAACANCHATGFTATTQDATTGEWLADAVDDANGAYDIDGDGTLDEVNIGCESCHGPGSAHVTAASHDYIIDYDALTPSRKSMICGSCHVRVKGADPSVSDGYRSEDRAIFLPGMSRAEVFASYASRKGPAAGDLQADNVHSKKHRQQYHDHVKSKHYRNSRILVTCGDCHDPHADRSLAGLQEYPHQLKGDPSDPDSTLCMSCHALDHTTHMQTETGSTHAGSQTACSDCHMPRTAKSGPGLYGRILSNANATDGVDKDEVYLMNDISSHVMDFVSKRATGVAGVAPSSAMPIPYTNRCSTAACHNVDELRLFQPED